MELTLRKVMPQDVDLLYRWANDKIVRRNAFHTEPIPYETHCAWFRDKLADKDILMFVLCAEESGQEVALGQVRLSVEDASAVIGYSIDEKYRGHGYGSRMILMAEDILRENRADVIYCKAQVKHENPASARVFEKCGYDRQESGQYLEFTKQIRG